MRNQAPLSPKGVRGPGRRALDRVVRAIQGNNDHIDGLIDQLQSTHNALDDNVQSLTDFVNERFEDIEKRLSDGGL